MTETQGWILITITGLFLLDHAYLHFDRWRMSKHRQKLFEDENQWWIKRFDFVKEQNQALMHLIDCLNHAIPKLEQTLREGNERKVVSQWTISDLGTIDSIEEQSE